MSDTKFTPGPWWAAIGKDQPVPYYRGLVAVLSSDPYISICTGETGDQSGRTCGGDEWEANAALIAAAPDLYEALKTINELLVYSVAILDAQGPDGVSDEDAMHLLLEQDRSPFREAHTKMNAALAKARGET